MDPIAYITVTDHEGTVLKRVSVANRDVQAEIDMVGSRPSAIGEGSIRSTWSSALVRTTSRKRWRQPGAWRQTTTDASLDNV